MKSDFEIPEYIASLLILVNFYVISNLPLGYVVKDIIYYVQIFLFLIFVITKFNFDEVLKFKSEGDKKVFYFEVILGVIFLFITLVLSLNNNNNLDSITKIITYVLLFILYFNFYSASLISNTYNLNKFLDSILIIGTINAFAGWFALFFLPSPSDLYQGFHLGFFHHPNTNATVFSIVVPTAFYKVIYSNKRNYLHISLFVILFISMLFTYSRATFIGVGIALLLLTLFKSGKIMIFFTAISLIIGFTVLDTFLLAKGGFSSISRLLLYYTAFQMIIENSSSMLFGYGVFRSLEIFVTEKLFTGSLEVVVDPHNMFLLLGIQFGLIITTMFTIFIIFVFILGTTRLNKVSKEHKNGLIISIAVIAGLLVQNQFEDILVYPEYFVYPIFLTFLGYIYHSFRFKINGQNI